MATLEISYKITVGDAIVSENFAKFEMDVSNVEDFADSFKMIKEMIGIGDSKEVREGDIK